MPDPVFSWSAPVYSDGTFTTAARISLPVGSSPIPGDVTEYIMRDRWMQLRRNFTPTALNTLHPEFKVANNWARDFYLVAETDREDAGNGLVVWDRIWAALPATHYEHETFVYNFIGFAGAYGVNAQTATGRDRKAKPVLSKLEFKYYLHDSTLQANSDPKYKTVGEIPLVAETRYYEAGFTTLETDYLKDSPPYATATVPSKTTYESWITDCATNKFGSQYVIAAETSRLSRWMGNLWQRVTRYVLAE